MSSVIAGAGAAHEATETTVVVVDDAALSTGAALATAVAVAEEDGVVVLATAHPTRTSPTRATAQIRIREDDRPET